VGEEKASGHGQQGRSLDDMRFQTTPFCFILYIEQWKFRWSMSSGHRERWPRSSMPWADRCVVQASTANDLVHTFKTMEGMLLLVPPRTPRSSGYDVYAHAVYVVICYMSITYIALHTPASPTIGAWSLFRAWGPPKKPRRLSQTSDKFP
jgi:hypothetical protein